jgi:hypothetical protein
MEGDMKRIALALVAALVLVGAEEARAQTSVQGSASITIPTLLSIDVSNTTVTFDQPDLTDYATGSIGMSSGASVIETRGNVTHRVTIEADAATMTGPTAKPASALQWGTGGTGGAFTGLSTTAADVVAGLTRGTHTSAAEVSYRMVLDEAADEPGTYSLAFTYTVVSN